ncbi:response regulator [Oxalobacteraceae bacterium OM1]|nr:response regulator [Oxalobacteraceae bacterium OM1]
MTRPVVFVAEEFARDIELIALALKEIGIDHILAVANDGAEAVRWFEEASNAEGNPGPVSIVFLGMKLQFLSGLDVLRRMRTLPAFAGTPVVLFSSALDGPVFAEARALGAHAPIARPDEFRTLVCLLRELMPRHMLTRD